MIFTRKIVTAMVVPQLVHAEAASVAPSRRAIDPKE
jgi:hypothetical protein